MCMHVVIEMSVTACAHTHTHTHTHTQHAHTHTYTSMHTHYLSTSHFVSSDSENEALEYKQLSAEWYTFQSHSSFNCLYNNVFIYHTL